MQKRFFIIPVLALLIICTAFVSKPHTNTLTATEPEITIDLLNRPVGLYRTYDDFLNGKAEDITFLYWKFTFANQRLLSFKAHCKVNGKEVDIPTNDFWGLRNQQGLYRCFATEKGKVGALPYVLKIVANGHYVWDQPATTENMRPALLVTDEFNGAPKESDFDHNADYKNYYKAFAYSKKGELQWDKCMENFKKVKGLKLVLDTDYGLGTQAMGFIKKHPDELKKYFAVNP